EAAQGRSPQAAALFSKAVALKPADATPYERLGRSLEQSAASPAEMEQAKQSLSQAVALEATLSQLDRVSVYLALGQICEREEQWKDALSWLQKAETLNPANSPIHYELARTYEKLGD